MKRKIIIKILFIALIILLTSSTTVYAVLSIESSSVSYDNTTTGLPNTVQGAIDRLYSRQEVEIEDWKSRYYALLNDPNQIPLRDYLRVILQENGTTVLQDDGTVDKNMRFIGANPNNWVIFNGENWRIIGVFNSNSHGMDEDLVKIERAEHLDTLMAWNSNTQNNWTTSSLKNYLNGEYYNGLTNNNSQSMIKEVIWKLGGIEGDKSYWIASRFYTRERGTTVYPGNATTWKGKIALSYASDYLYATSGNGTDDYSRNKCLDYYATMPDNTTNSFWKTTSSLGECSDNSWLTKKKISISNSNRMWTLTHRSGNQNYAMRVIKSNSGGVFGNQSDVTNLDVIYPALYLKSSVICTNCNEADVGSSTNPFELSYTEE